MAYADPQDMRDYLRNWRAARRAAWFAGKSCAHCGSIENLELDHIDPATKISCNVWGWAQERREAELAKCQPLCHSCHLAKTKANGESPHGVNNGNAKLNENKVHAIRASGKTHRELAEEYGVSKTTITHIKQGLRWSHVE